MAKLNWDKLKQYELVKKRNKATLQLSARSKLKFGKHRGQTVEWVYKNDNSYYHWLVSEKIIELRNNSGPEPVERTKEDKALIKKSGYSTITLGTGMVYHIFDHGRNKVLCGLDRWFHKPFTIQKKTFVREGIIEKHTTKAERRGGPNPFKFVCRKCLLSLDKDYEKTVDRVYKERERTIPIQRDIGELDNRFTQLTEDKQ